MKIAVYPNLKKKNAFQCTVETCKVLNGLGLQIFLDESYKDILGMYEYINFGDFTKILKNCDIIIVIGGDGTILKCSKLVASLNTPILGINSGRVGFMASIEANELHLLKNLISGNYRTVNRMMLKCRYISADGEIKENSALNDVVVSKGQSCKIADFEVSLNNQVISSLRADGLIFSSPTGATAYSLSAGGPIIEPDMECIEFTQICPFSLFARTMVFSPDKTLKVTFKSNKGSTTMISVDGSDNIDFTPDDVLYISKSENYIRFIEIGESNFYHSINTKLMKPLKGIVEVFE